MSTVSQISEQLQKYPQLRDQHITDLRLLSKQGYNNTIYLLETKTSRYIVRILSDEDRDRDRELEYRVQREAYSLGIGAKPILLDTIHGIMVSRYIAGTHHSRLNHAEIVALATAIKTLHTIEIDSSTVSPREMIDPQTPQLDSAMRYIDTQELEIVLCHHDLNPQNILFGDNKATLIDWEYANHDDRYFDLASIVVEFGLGEESIAVFMDIYFGTSSKLNSQKLDAYCTVYRAVCDQWWQDRESPRV